MGERTTFSAEMLVVLGGLFLVLQGYPLVGAILVAWAKGVLLTAHHAMRRAEEPVGICRLFQACLTTVYLIAGWSFQKIVWLRAENPTRSTSFRHAFPVWAKAAFTETNAKRFDGQSFDRSANALLSQRRRM